MSDLKLFMEDFNPSIGKISYSVENENGDRVARAEYTHEDLKSYSPSTMDFFLLSYLPQLMRIGGNLQVMGPISKNLLGQLEGLMGYIKTFRPHWNKCKIITTNVSQVDSRVYGTEDIEKFVNVFEKNLNLDETLEAVFNYYE